MYVVPKVVPRFILMRGRTRIGEFFDLMGVGRHLGISAVRSLYHEEHSPQREFEWYAQVVGKPVNVSVHVIGPDGEVVSWERVFKSCLGFVISHRHNRFHFWNGEGPVPGIHRSRSYRFKRRPRTAQELRLAAGVVHEDGEPEWRARRKNIPTMWDDLILHRDHCWKRHRKTQWK